MKISKSHIILIINILIFALNAILTNIENDNTSNATVIEKVL